MDPLEQLYSVLQSEPPAWPIWQAPELGRPWLLGAGYEHGAGFDQVRLSYFRPADLRQAIIESRATAPSNKKLGWYLHRLEEATDVAGIEEIFSPPSQEFHLVGAEERPATASLGGSVAEGTTLQLGRSSVSVFVTPAATSTIVFLRRGYPMDDVMPEFLPLDDFSSARTERQDVLNELRAGG